MRVTSKGQVTIPIHMRQQLGIDEQTEVEFELVDDVIQIRKVARPSGRGKRIIDHLVSAKYRGPSTDELMALTRGKP